MIQTPRPLQADPDPAADVAALSIAARALADALTFDLEDPNERSRLRSLHRVMRTRLALATQLPQEVVDRALSRYRMGGAA